MGNGAYNEIYGHFQNICALLGEQLLALLGNWAFWVLMLLLLCSIVLTYSRAVQGRLSGSVVGIVRQLASFVFDTVNSVVRMVKSLTGFVDVLRLLFFGRLGNSMLYVITNYAIIFLSIASFMTTQEGLSTLIGWIPGTMVSFGTQSLELVAVMGLIFCWVPPQGKLKETVEYVYAFSDEKDPFGCRDKKQEPARETGGGSATDSAYAPKGETTQEEDVAWWICIWTRIKDRLRRRCEDFKKPNQHRSVFWWGRFRRKALPLVLLAAYASSVFFSYCFMFNAIVMPTIAYDDYMESIDLVRGNIGAFEQELTAYRSDLVLGLNRLNNDVSASFENSDYDTLESRIQIVRSNLESAERSAASAWEAAQAAEGTPSYDTLLKIYENANLRRTQLIGDLATLETELSSSAYGIFQAIQLLSQYYMDPLYLMQSNPDMADTISAVSNAFNTVLSEALRLSQTDSGSASGALIDEDSLRLGFNNYTLLSRYYAEHGKSGLDLSGGEDGADGVETLLASRGGILAEYDRLQNDESAGSTAEERQAQASSYLNGETGKLLIAATQALESVPQFSTVGTLWPGGEGEGITPHEPGATGYLSQFMQKYRVSSGQLSLQERAVFKLFSSNSTTARFSLLMAIALDGMIIALCAVRERKYYANNARNRRQMVGILLMRTTTDEERESNEQGRRIILGGSVLGCFVYLLYFRAFPNGGASSAVAAFVLIVCGIMLLTLLEALRNVFRKKEDAENDDPIKARLRPMVYDVLSSSLNSGRFWRRSYVRRPAETADQRGAEHYLKEKKIWHQKEDHRIRPYVLKCEEYEKVVTSCSRSMEYYIPETELKGKGLNVQLAILVSHGLVYCVDVPVDPADQNSPKKTAYLLTKDLICVLYESVLLREVAGSSWDYSMEDDLLDYEREDDDEEE